MEDGVDMTKTIHSCSLYCDRPECIRQQRDMLRDALESGRIVEVADALPDGAESTAKRVAILRGGSDGSR